MEASPLQQTIQKGSNQYFIAPYFWKQQIDKLLFYYVF